MALLNSKNVFNLICFFSCLDDKLNICFITKQKFNSLFEESDVTDAERRKFYEAVRSFYMKAVQYAVNKLVFDDVLTKAKWVDFSHWLEANFNDVMYFANRWAIVLKTQKLTLFLSYIDCILQLHKLWCLIQGLSVKSGDYVFFRFKSVLRCPGETLEEVIQADFTDYQIYSLQCLPPSQLEMAKVFLDASKTMFFYRIDVLWGRWHKLGLH